MTTPFRGSRGATLVELLVALTVGAMVLASALRLALGATRSTDRTRERVRQQALFRASGSVLARELSGLDPASDMSDAAAESLTVRAVRGTGRTCGVDAGAVVIGLATYRAWRLPDASRDSLRVPSLSGDAWMTVPIDGTVARTLCADGTPGLRIHAGESLAVRAAAGSIAIRVVEWVRFRVYSNADGWWLGQRSLRQGDATQPVAGPFAARSLAFRFLDGQGVPTLDHAMVSSIALAMRTDHDGTARGVASDSTVAWVTLGGAP